MRLASLLLLCAGAAAGGCQADHRETVTAAAAAPAPAPAPGAAATHTREESPVTKTIKATFGAG